MTWPEELAEADPALGAVVEEERGTLPFALVHGESLVACAAWALGEAEVTQVDLGTDWTAVVEAGRPLVLHDPLCPLTPASFVAECVARSRADDAVVVGVRPVTDTVKVVSEGTVGATVDRDALLTIASPIVLPPAVLASLRDLLPSDFAAAVTLLRRDHDVVLLEAPPQARRVSSPADLRVLEALTGPNTRPAGYSGS